MSSPKHQHFIPKSYLRNFAVEQAEAQVVEAKLRSEDDVKDKLISIRDICVNKNLYTLPHKEGDEKYALENFYAQEIDQVYPEVYGWLTDQALTKISAEQRTKIIMTTMSLFFRTPKFLNSNQRTTNLVLDYAARNFQDNNGNVKFKFKDTILDFNIKDIENVRSDLKAKNKITFLQDHIKDWHEFVNFKMLSAISVYRLIDDSELISGDNPVIMHNVTDRSSFNLFDPANMISLPLDNKNYLSIFPNTEEAMLDTIYRTDRDKWFSLTINLQVEQNCEDWIIGKPGSVKKHLADQQKYGQETPENLKEVEDMKKRAEDGLALAKIMGEFGFPHSKVLEKVREMLNDRVHQNDIEIKKIALELAKHGYYV